MKHLFSETDPFTGLTSKFEFDGRNLVETTSASRENTKVVLDSNTRLANETAYAKRGIKEDWHHVARIPAEVQLEWLLQGFDVLTAPAEEVLKKCRERDYNKVRVTSGGI